MVMLSYLTGGNMEVILKYGRDKKDVEKI